MNKMNSFANKSTLIAAVMMAGMLAGCGSSNDDKVETPAPTPVPVEPQPPVISFLTVTAMSPAKDATDVKVMDAVVSATLSREVVAETITPQSFGVQCGERQIQGSVSYDASTRTAMFKATESLPYNNVCAATLTTAVVDNAKVSFDGNYSWKFTTELDKVGPRVVTTSPVNNAGDVSTNSQIKVEFNEDIDVDSLNNNFTVSNAANIVSGKFDYQASTRTASFIPSVPLNGSTQYLVSLSNVKDKVGNVMDAQYNYSFTTSAQLDIVPPAVFSFNPAPNASNVCRTSVVSVVMNEDVDPTTVSRSSVVLTSPGQTIFGRVQYDASTRTITYTNSVAGGFPELAQVTVTLVSGQRGIKDLAGNALASDVTSTFNTSASACN
jgi:hypothetical protein